MASSVFHRDPFAILSKDLTYHEQLGHGASGTVYRATLCKDDGTRVEVAAKKIHRATDDLDRIEQGKEVQYLRRLNHPNIIEFYGTVVDSDELVIVTEYAFKGSLDDYLRNERNHGRKLPQDQVYDWAIQAAKAIRYLQEMKVAHRDIKSPNFVITADNVLKLCDFGIAKDLSVSVSVDSIKGTYRWLAPEVFKEQRLSPASDLFSYGIVVWEMQACEVPYRGLKVPAHIMYKVGTENMRPLIPADCPKDINALIQQCWDEDREKRPIIDEAIVALCRSKRAGHNYLKECSTQTDVIDIQLDDLRQPRKLEESSIWQYGVNQIEGTVANPGGRTPVNEVTSDFFEASLITTSAITRPTTDNLCQLEVPGHDERSRMASESSNVKNPVKIINPKWTVENEFVASVDNEQVTFPNATCVTSNPDGGIVVADPGHKSILFFGEDGKLHKTFDFSKVKQEKYKCFRPMSIVITSMGYIFATGNLDGVHYFDSVGDLLCMLDIKVPVRKLAINKLDILAVLSTREISIYSCKHSSYDWKVVPVQTIQLNQYFRTSGNVPVVPLIMVNSLYDEVYTCIENEGYTDLLVFNFKGEKTAQLSPKMKHDANILAMSCDVQGNLYIAIGTFSFLHGVYHISQFTRKGEFISRIATLECYGIHAMTGTASGSLCILSHATSSSTAIHILRKTW